MEPTSTVSEDGLRQNPPALRALEVTKRYGRILALDSVDFGVGVGEIVGLLGANGAGKSTLLKVITGTVAPDSGTILVGADVIPPHNVKASQAAGIAAVHQELSLVPTATVAENILLWRLPRTAGFVSSRRMVKRAAEVLERLGVDIDPRAVAAGLTAVEQRLVMVAAAISQDVRVLILDEPTACLPPDEAERVLSVARGLPELGKSVIFVSHRLDEVCDLVDRAVVMRDGRAVSELAGDQLKVEVLVDLIGGRRLAEVDRAAKASVSEIHERKTLIFVRDVSGGKVQNVSLDVREGEILGVAGLVGAGRSELLRLIAGVQKPSSGKVEIIGDRPEGRSVDRRRDAIGYVGEHRGGSLFGDFDVTGNVSLPSLRSFSRFGTLVNRGAERRAVEPVIRSVELKGEQSDAVWSLSGGNKQKVLLGRWLLRGSRVLILDEPTAGIDVGARLEIHRLLRGITEEGGGVVVAIAEPKELLALCDRVIVLREGRVSYETSRVSQETTTPFDEGEIVAAFYGNLAPTGADVG
jgi:ribose transport system ATP-binding protein